MGGGRNIEVRPGTMTQGNKYERECLGLQIRKRHQRTARVALAAHKPFAPVSRSSCRQAQAPARLWSKPHLPTVVFFFLSTGGRLSTPNPPQTQQPSLSLVARRRIGGKIIKILLCGQRGQSQPLSGAVRSQKRQKRGLRETRRFCTLTAGRNCSEEGRGRGSRANGSKT